MASYLVVLAVFTAVYISWILFKRLASYLISTQYYKNYFASGINDCAAEYNKSLRQYKMALFEQLESSLEKVGGDILEIGAGTGANFEFFPNRSSVIALDPSPAMRRHFEVNKEKFSHLCIKRFIEGCAEDMKEIPDQSIAAVVCTKTMCSIKEKRKALLEFKRVLKPGGSFFFLEHVAAPRGTWQRVLQDLVGWTGLWEALHQGCSCNCELWVYIDEAGFREVSYKQFIPPKQQKTMWISPWLLYSSHLMGHAQM